ncbi:hypothetical protein BDP55DRAFT_719667 [Colletotrichum godetiae]|uniref:Uncharacterized protein n=1 Tax=Colletotrichum godetiae TaxID=1209918 RepID=A0AAJ0AAR3_9PEZI|nr:uncharacterized protein BDP55DRAFT_719667 [Colletotrichum godetiae]KAK1659728.1 hypothetical protein BDP55DRAFT_719667 [Colletotrichum godetiae]
MPLHKSLFRYGHLYFKRPKGLTSRFITQAAMEKGCVDPDPLEEGLGFILYAITWWVVQIGMVRMVATTPTCQPEPEIEMFGSTDAGSISNVDDDMVEGIAGNEQTVEKATIAKPSLMKPTPEEKLASETLASETLPSTTTTRSPTESMEPTPTSESHIPPKPQKVILRPKRFKRRTEVQVDLNATFTLAENAILERFLEALRTERTTLFMSLGFVLPTILATLVSISSEGPSSQTATEEADATRDATTLIRISGLTKWKHICSFHNVMIQNPNLFAPLELCYHKEKIRRIAREASCAIRHPAQTRTLCGCPIVVQTPDLGQRTSTIGGLLTVKSNFYALTTSHVPDDEDEFPDEVDYDSDSDESSLFFYDNDADSDYHNSGSVTLSASEDYTNEKSKTAAQVPETESPDANTTKGAAKTAEDDALGISPEGPGSDTAGFEQYPEKLGAEEPSHTPLEDLSRKRGYLINPIEATELRSGDDWLLVPVGTDFLFPNRIPEGSERPSTWQTPFIEGFWPDLGKLFIDHDQPHEPPSRQTVPQSRVPLERRRRQCSRVWALSAMHGLVRSNLSPNPSFMLSGGGERVSKVWTVEAEAHSQGFQAGDSGSWIVDDRSRRVLGILVARVGGVGYMVSFAGVRQNIASTLRIRPTSIQLASRLDPRLRGRSGGQVLRSSSPFRRQPEPDTRSWGQWLSDGWAAILDVVLHPINLGYKAMLLVLATAMAYLYLLWRFPVALETLTSLQLALLPPALVLFFWALSELETRPGTANRTPEERLLLRRNIYTWAWISFVAGILVGFGIYLVRPPVLDRPPRSPEMALREWNKLLDSLNEIDVQGSYDSLMRDLQDLQWALLRLDFRFFVAKLKAIMVKLFFPTRPRGY